MKKYKILKNIFIILALILSHMMCIDTAYNYASFICGIKHRGFSAPASTAFLFSIPHAIGIILCIILALVFNRKSRFK